MNAKPASQFVIMVALLALDLACTGQDPGSDASVAVRGPTPDGGETEVRDGGDDEDAGFPQDAGADDAGFAADGGDPWWAQFPTVCPSEEVRVPSEQLHQPILPDPIGETPRLLWQHRVLCSGTDDFFEDQVSDRDHVQARLEIGGVATDVVVVASQTFTDLMVPTIDSVAYINTSSGERLGCNSFATHGSIPSTARTPLIYAPPLGHVLGYVGALEDGVDEVTPSETGVVLGTLGDERSIRVFYPVLPGNPPSTDAALGYTGIFFTPLLRERIVGFDLFSNIVAFVKDPSMGGGVAGITTMDTGLPVAQLPPPPPGQWSRPYWLSQCGDIGPSVVETPISYKPPSGLLAWNDVVVYQEDVDGQLVVNSGGVPLVFSPPLLCRPIATTSFTEVLCLSLVEGGVLLTQVDVSTGLLEERTVQWESVGQTFTSVLAGRNGVVIVVADNIAPEPPPALPTRSRTLYFLDWQSGIVTSFSVFEPPSFLPPPYEVSRDPPTISPAGILVSSVWGVTFAVQTDVEGLAVAPYPRGRLGGNQNRGAIQPPN